MILATVIRRLLAGAALAAVGAGGAGAAGEAARVNPLAGYVLYTSGADATSAHAFMNVHKGDMFEVPAGVSLKVVYLEGGRQEAFRGPATFVVGMKQSSVQTGGPPGISTLPAGVPQKLLQTPELVQIARLGTEGPASTHPVAPEPRLTPQQQAEVREARAIYSKLRAETTPDDITPELYLYSVLQDNLLFDEMKPLVGEMARRQPGNRDVAVLRDYVDLKTGQK